MKRCPGMMTDKPRFLELFASFGKYDDLGIYFRISAEQIWSMHAPDCTEEFASRLAAARGRGRGSKSRGTCENCRALERTPKLAKRFYRMESVDRALRILDAPTVAEKESEEYQFLVRFNTPNQYSTNEKKKILLNRVRIYLDFVRKKDS